MNAPRWPVVCVSCGWRDGNEAGELSSALGIAHLAVCPNRDVALYVPMWSVGWPYYWAVERGEVSADSFTFEVAWTVRPAYTKHGPSRLMTGGDAKEWYFFESAANRAIYGVWS